LQPLKYISTNRDRCKTKGAAKNVIIVNGNGSDLTNNRTMNDRANGKVITQKMVYSLLDVVKNFKYWFWGRITPAKVEEAVTQIERRIKTAHKEVTLVFVESQSFEGHFGGKW